MHSGAAAAAAANAVKACGAIIHVMPDEFLAVLNLVSEPLVVVAESGIFSKHYKYLMGHKGMVFYTKSPTELSMTKRVEWIHAKRVSVPM
jgi:hypothetical protein